ncbi:anti-sigma factor RsiW [Paraburkholderia caballeronis]|uniref:zf-HC2 domain-containing protein n=1 Tax=Paraburkholderia caballeronis TaxID=416943 RepID=UPI001065C9DC|nr:zf-HC2 domain-containing protein [Paraburkholderia caballeronis]TDV36312.1 anti-sigma factor RsiW [Paraburkholderia caballeronis]
MNCDETRPLVGASVDRELSAGDEWRVREHLAGCADCRRAADAVLTVGQAVRGATYHRAPAGLGAGIVAALGAVEDGADVPPDPVVGESAMGGAARAARRRRSAWRDLLRPLGGGHPATGARIGAAPAAGWVVAALLALALVATAVTSGLRSSGGAGAFVDELVASHVRAQLSGRDLDVPSSDRHTVKPWFNGRIDYAPPVEDLAAAGFPLAGGRLDYVGRERVAVLVYRYRKHVIDVYVFPPGARTAALAAPPSANDGFALARWQDGGMTWWAVTDAGPDVLAAFRPALDARLHGG